LQRNLGRGAAKPYGVTHKGLVYEYTKVVTAASAKSGSEMGFKCLGQGRTERLADFRPLGKMDWRLISMLGLVRSRR
jgi:hypothetical protein